MVVMMDMASGIRIHEGEELNMSSTEVSGTEPAPHPALQLRLQVALPELARRPLLREPLRETDEFMRVLGPNPG